MNGLQLDSFQGLIDFAKYFVAALGFLLVFCAIYCKVTPYDELKLVREGKTAPAISFGGAFIGFVLPLHSHHPQCRFSGHADLGPGGHGGADPCILCCSGHFQGSG